MPGFDGTGPNGTGPMTGGGRGYCNPRGMVVGMQRNFHRRMTPNVYPHRRTHDFGRFVLQPTSEEELGFLKNEAQSLSNALKTVEARIQELETKT